MSKPKPPVVKYPIKWQRGTSHKIVYRTIKNIQQLKNSQQLGTATINNQSRMVRKEGIYWIVL
ncbi:hypothetical protein [Anabaena sp. UHCC 0399]|uniref:hypothetical protein n=1 Tax=Anabaena sp. UHCC 0399 TaxID=3110238 RepID=UPI002B1F6BCF|nr:hypothetical protein [Anabaena sp. UHCC 0399]MEA5567805.1 hypothetical protein [Anabaena sp. UHCC 0399]